MKINGPGEGGGGSVESLSIHQTSHLELLSSVVSSFKL